MITQFNLFENYNLYEELLFRIYDNDLIMVEKILKNNIIDLNDRAENTHTLIFDAIAYKLPEMTKLLIKYGADVNNQDNNTKIYPLLLVTNKFSWINVDNNIEQEFEKIIKIFDVLNSEKNIDWSLKDKFNNNWLDKLKHIEKNFDFKTNIYSSPIMKMTNYKKIYEYLIEKYPKHYELYMRYKNMNDFNI